MLHGRNQKAIVKIRIKCRLSRRVRTSGTWRTQNTGNRMSGVSESGLREGAHMFVAEFPFCPSHVRGREDGVRVCINEYDKPLRGSSRIWLRRFCLCT